MLPKIAYIVNSLNLGGTEQLVVQMAQAFSGEFDISVVCLDEPGIWATRLRDQGIGVYCLWRQPGIDLSMVTKLAAFNRRHRIQLIHAHQCTPWFYAALSRTLYATPRLLFEEHGRLYPEVENLKRAALNRVVIQRLTHRVIAVSEDVRTRVAKYEGVPQDKIEVIYNGTASLPPMPSRERAMLRQSLGLAEDDFVVGTVGRFDPIKNLPLLIHAMADLHPKLPTLRLLLIGDGPCYPEICRLVQGLGIADRIVMPGYRQDAARLIQCMDLFALCSFSEGTSMALLEAMAAGVPAVVTAVGGNPELVRNGESGWVFPSGDVDGLSRAVLQAHGQPDLAVRFARAGARRYGEKFTFERMIEEYRECYAAMTNEGQ